MGDDETLIKAKLALAFLLLILLALIIQSVGEAGGCPLGYSEWDDPVCDDGNPLNGYWWRDFGVWVPGMIKIETWFTPSPDYFWGKAVYYAPGIMEATAAWRGFDLDEYAGGVALMSPADIGSIVWLRPSYFGNFRGSGWEGPFLVVDCARKGDMWPVVMHRGEAVEVDYRTALRWNMIGKSWGSAMRMVQVSKVQPYLLDDIAWWELFRFCYQEDEELICIYTAESNGKKPPIYFPDWFEDRIEFTDHYEPRVHFRPPNEWRINGEWMTFNNYHELHREPKRAKFPDRRIR